MQVKIFTLPFDEQTESFPDEIVEAFCLNKKVLRIETSFFRKEDRPYWSVAVHYDLIVPGRDKPRDLGEEERLLLQRLKEWRKEEASKLGLPAYLIATNAQFIQAIRLKCRTLECLKSVKGFGKKRIQQHGRRIVELVRGFYEENAENGTPTSETPEKAVDGDLPFT